MHKDIGRGPFSLLLCLLISLTGCAVELTPQERQVRRELSEKLQPWRQYQRDRLNFIGLALQEGAGRLKMVTVTLYAGEQGDRFEVGCSGQTVFVFEGMMRFLSNDDEVAFVVAHELAHCLDETSLAPLSEQEADTQALLDMYRAGFDLDSALETLARLATEVPASQRGWYFQQHAPSLERIAHAGKAAEALKVGAHPVTGAPLLRPVSKVTYDMTSWVDVERVTRESRWLRRLDAESRAFLQVLREKVDASKERVKKAEATGDAGAIEQAQKELEATRKAAWKEVDALKNNIYAQTSLPFHRAIVRVTREGLFGDPNARLAEMLDRVQPNSE